MTEQEKKDIKEVEGYLNKGVNRPVGEFYIEYNPITFYPKLKRVIVDFR